MTTPIPGARRTPPPSKPRAVQLTCLGSTPEAKIEALTKAVELGDEHLVVEIQAVEPFAAVLCRAVEMAGGTVTRSRPSVEDPAASPASCAPDVSGWANSLEKG